MHRSGDEYSPPPDIDLLSQTQALDEGTVTCDILALQVCEKIASVTDHAQKTSVAVVVLLVSLQMLGKSIDAIGKNRNLNLRRTGVALMGLVLLDNLLLNFLRQHCFFTFLFYLFPVFTVSGG